MLARISAHSSCLSIAFLFRPFRPLFNPTRCHRIKYNAINGEFGWSSYLFLCFCFFVLFSLHFVCSENTYFSTYILLNNTRQSMLCIQILNTSMRIKSPLVHSRRLLSLLLLWKSGMLGKLERETQYRKENKSMQNNGNIKLEPCAFDIQRTKYYYLKKTHSAHAGAHWNSMSAATQPKPKTRKNSVLLDVTG